MFQFQYGTIKSLIPISARKHRFVFQFQYGTIKRISELEERVKFYSFNSNMVRLKEFDNSLAELGKTMFQFQYGTIKRKE